MSIEDRHGNPLELNHLYVDLKDIIEDRTRPFPMNYTNGLCKVTGLNPDIENLSLQITDEITSSILKVERVSCIQSRRKINPFK